MTVQSRTNEEKFFERTRIALVNALEQESIKMALANFEYNEAKVAWLFRSDHAAIIGQTVPL